MGVYFYTFSYTCEMIQSNLIHFVSLSCVKLSSNDMAQVDFNNNLWHFYIALNFP